jgi:hypothetical protein
MGEEQTLLTAIRSHGCDATDLRDAAHEAHHALDARVRGKWSRERIHRALVAKASKSGLGRSTLVSYEIDARAVEWIICERYGIAYDLDAWANTMWWETAKNMNIQLPNDGWIQTAIRMRKESARITRAADAVQAIAELRGRVKR